MHVRLSVYFIFFNCWVLNVWKQECYYKIFCRVSVKIFDDRCISADFFYLSSLSVIMTIYDVPNIRSARLLASQSKYFVVAMGLQIDPSFLFKI